MRTSRKIYLCTTNLCQLQCVGCYASALCGLKGNQLDLKFARKVIDESIKEVDDVECVFHGGEPFFNRSDKIIQTYIDLINEYPNVRWSATTNLVYEITPKLNELFNLFTNKFIKTSWDVDSYRFKNKQQLDKWESNIKYLLDQGFNVEVIITVNTNTIKHSPSEIMDYMSNLGIKCINFERITETGRAAEVKVKPLNCETDKWLYEAFQYNKCKQFSIPLFDELKAIVEGAEPIGCRLRQCMRNVRTLNANNTLSTCPNMADVTIGKYDGEYKYNESEHQKLIEFEKKKSLRCLTCKYYNICKGDCCQLQFDESGCPGLRKILEEICE